MNIQQGLFDHAVIQRDANDVTDQVIVGTSSVDGELFAKITAKGKAVRGFALVSLGRASHGGFSVRLRGLPIGGPYQVELSIKPKGAKPPADTLVVRDILVGDVWIAAGQSNMQGCGRRTFAAKPMSAVRAFYMNDLWAVAQDPIHNMWECVDQVHIDFCGGARRAADADHGGGPAVAFAQEMHRRTGVPQGVLACAHGGTSMSQWDPSLRDQEGKSLYGATIRRVNKNGGRVRGMVWYQGESDAFDEGAANYTDRMKTLVAALRKDLGTPKLPVAIVQIGRVTEWGSAGSAWNSIQDQQGKLPSVIRNLATVASIDLGLCDSIHIDGPDMDRLGKRLAVVMGHLVGLPKAPAPLMVDKISVVANPESGNGDVVIEMKNVAGRLRSDGPPRGFAFDGRGGARIFRVDLEGNRIICRSSVQKVDLDGCMMHYGRGTDPVCTITDEADRGLLVFGPVMVSPARPVTDFANQAEVSELLKYEGAFADLQYPRDMTSLNLAKRTFEGDFLNRHVEFAGRADENIIAWYRLKLNCPEKMSLAMQLGYDGPVKAWMNGKEIYSDPKGTNPAIKDAKRVLIDAPAGKHELLFALDGNRGRAWGIFVRFERLNVSKSAIASGAFVVPEIVV